MAPSIQFVKTDKSQAYCDRSKSVHGKNLRAEMPMATNPIP